MKRFLLLAALLPLTACTSSDVITVATAAVSAEMVIGAAEGCADCVAYGNAALDGLACAATEAASADAKAAKEAKVGLCITNALALAPSGPLEAAIAAAISAALRSVLAAYGIAPAPPTPGAARTIRRVALHDGRPGYFELHALLNAAHAALAAKRPVAALQRRADWPSERSSTNRISRRIKLGMTLGQAARDVVLEQLRKAAA